ncbi:MAG: ferritin family protein [Acidimicrobiales bacterium]
MMALSDERLLGASVAEQELFDAIVAHERSEEETISDYESLAATTSSQAVAYVLGLIVEDERRHHRILTELANTVRSEATMVERGRTVPTLDARGSDTALKESTRRFMEMERRDHSELKRLARRIRANSESPLAVLVVDMLVSDTRRHIKLLRRLRRLVRKSRMV